MQHIKKVFVIHKTHLDIGFTALGAEVLTKYVDQFIPAAIDTAYACNKESKQFIWTVGSYMIDYYLRTATKSQVEKLEKAIADGYITWHALPCTTHTEVMNADLFRYGISIAKKLDSRFGHKTIAAKMTDVPGHTHAMIPLLAQADIAYLHIGINESSRVVKVPALCVWKYGDHDIILNYAGDYGKPATIGDIALEFAHTADNMGPPTIEAVTAEMARLQAKYPNAEVVSSTLDEFAMALLPFKDQLPVVDREIGDTWIHGLATDPFKVGLFLELLHLEKEWQAQGGTQTESYTSFMEKLLLVAEHTWGMDIKKYFYDFKNWSKADFKKARKENKTDLEQLSPAGTVITEFVKEQLHHYTDGIFKGGYEIFEASWAEQRAYAIDAIQFLPDNLKEKAMATVALLQPKKPEIKGKETTERHFTLGGKAFSLYENGSIQIGEKTIGLLSYDVYSSKTVERCFYTYNRNFDTVQCWSEPDFSKPNLDSVAGLQDREFPFAIEKVCLDGDMLSVLLCGDAAAAAEYGCPRKALICYDFSGEGVKIHLSCFDKDANKMPEALYFGFVDTKATGATVEKLGLPINPYVVQEGGNRKLHGIESLSYGDMRIISRHAPLLSVGGKNIYEVDESYGKPTAGMHYVLFDNRWGTNFRQWYEENMYFFFQIEL